MIISLNFLLDWLLIFTSFNSFSEVLIFLHLELNSSISSFCLIVFIYFYMLGSLVTFPDIGQQSYVEMSYGGQQHTPL